MNENQNLNDLLDNETSSNSCSCWKKAGKAVGLVALGGALASVAAYCSFYVSYGVASAVNPVIDWVTGHKFAEEGSNFPAVFGKIVSVYTMARAFFYCTSKGYREKTNKDLGLF